MTYKSLVLGTVLFVMMVGVVPQVGFANEPSRLVPECTGIGGECTICDLVALGKSIIDFLVYGAVAMATLLFVNAGVLYVLSPTSPSNISKAHSIFSTTLVGLMIVLSGWLLIDFVMKALYSDSEGSKSWGPWNNILCKEGTRTNIPTPPTGGVTGVTAGGRSSVTEVEARTAVDPYARVWESAPGRTTLAGMQETTLQGIATMAEDAKKYGVQRDQFIITGGTEDGHASGDESHANGYKVDFEDTIQMNNYIENGSTFTRVGSRDGDPQYVGTVNGKEVECVREIAASHWDCTF